MTQREVSVLCRQLGDPVIQISTHHVYNTLYVFMLACISNDFSIGRQDSAQYKLLYYDLYTQKSAF